MVLGETVLCKRAKKYELKGSQKITFTPACMSALEELLHDVYVFFRPTPNDYYHRNDLVRVFNVMAKEIYGSSNDFPVVEAFGSFLMDMFSAKSDLDLSVNFSNDAIEFPRDKKISALRKFAKLLFTLQRKGHVSGVHPIMRARVPILKVVDRGTGIECDISVENKDGVAKSQIVHIISAIDERFQKLSFLMKAWAKAYDINSSKDHTLNSLSIILLVAFHLQTRDPPIFPPLSALFKDGTDPASVTKVVQGFLQYGKRNEESLAELFVALLSKLASVETLWPEGLCASTYDGSWISKTWDSQVGYISVEDFSDRSQNVARSVGVAEVKKIYNCINSSLHHLSAFVDGRIQAPKLKALLFGPETTTTIDKNAMVNPKRSIPDPAPIPAKKPRFKEGWDPWGGVNQAYGESPSNVPLDPLPTKKTQLTEGWGSWGGVNLRNGEIPSNAPPSTPPIPQQPPFVAPEIGFGLQQMPTEGSHGASLHPTFVPSQYGGGLQEGPVGFGGPHGPNLTFSMPCVGLGHAQPRFNQNPGQGPPLNPYGHG